MKLPVDLCHWIQTNLSASVLKLKLFTVRSKLSFLHVIPVFISKIRSIHMPFSYQGCVYLSHLSSQGQYPHDSRGKDCGPKLCLCWICCTVDGQNCILVILQWGVSLVTIIITRSFGYHVTLTADVQVLAVFFRTWRFCILWLLWVTSYYRAATNSLCTVVVSFVWHTGLLHTKWSLWEIKLPVATY